MLAGRSDDFRRHFLITHFFNPVRFIKLLELVPGPQTDPELMRFMGQFAHREAGQGRRLLPRTRPTSSATASAPMASWSPSSACSTRATPSRRWTRSSARRWAAHARPPSAPPIWPGIDTFAHVADNLYENLPDDPQRELFKHARLRARDGQARLDRRQGRAGLLQARAKATRASEILAHRPRDAGVSPAAARHFASIDAVKRNPDVFERIRGLVNSDDRAGKLAWELTADTLLYTAARRRRSPTTSSTSTTRCAGASTGRSAPSRRGTRSAWRRRRSA